MLFQLRLCVGLGADAVFARVTRTARARCMRESCALRVPFFTLRLVDGPCVVRKRQLLG